MESSLTISHENQIDHTWIYQLNVVQLKAELAMRCKPTNGLKLELQNRLLSVNKYVLISENFVPFVTILF